MAGACELEARATRNYKHAAFLFCVNTPRVLSTRGLNREVERNNHAERPNDRSGRSLPLLLASDVEPRVHDAEHHESSCEAIYKVGRNAIDGGQCDANREVGEGLDAVLMAAEAAADETAGRRIINGLLNRHTGIANIVGTSKLLAMIEAMPQRPKHNQSNS